MAKPDSAASPFWGAFAKEFNETLSYWYVPKGASIADIEAIRKRLAVLAEFRGERWSGIQQAYVRALKKKGLFHARAHGQNRQDRAAIAYIPHKWLAVLVNYGA